MFKTARISTTIFLVAAIAVAVNILSDNYFFRIDLSEGKEFTLSTATRNILRELDNPVTITAYFSRDLPPNIGNISGALRDMLIEYGNRSKGMVVYKFVNPNEKKELEDEAVKNGIQPVMINVREKDQIRQQKAYMGAVVAMGEGKETIPFFQPGAAMEYALSTAIKKLSVRDKPVIAFIGGHGEPGLNEIPQALSDLSVLYSIEEFNLTDTADIPVRFKTVGIVGPKDTISPLQLKKLDNFLNQGGNILLAINRVEGDFSNAMGMTVNVGLDDWLRKNGAVISGDFIIDTKCNSIQVQQQQGNFIMSTQMSFPYLPVISKFSDHPAVKGLESVALQFASPINSSGDSTVNFIPLAYSSEKSGTQKAPLYFDIQKQWTQDDFTLSDLVVACVLEKKSPANRKGKIILISDGDFAVNGPRRGVQLPQDNVSLLVNSIDWLSDDTGLIDLRTKEVTSRPIKELSDGKKAFLKWFNFILPVILIVLYGLVRMQINRNKRIKWMEANYE